MKLPRLTIRELVLAVALVGVSLAWWVERRRGVGLATDLARTKLRITWMSQQELQLQDYAANGEIILKVTRNELADCRERVEAMERELEEKRKP